MKWKRKGKQTLAWTWKQAEYRRHLFMHLEFCLQCMYIDAEGQLSGRACLSAPSPCPIPWRAAPSAWGCGTAAVPALLR